MILLSRSNRCECGHNVIRVPTPSPLTPPPTPSHYNDNQCWQWHNIQRLRYYPQATTLSTMHYNRQTLIQSPLHGSHGLRKGSKSVWKAARSWLNYRKNLYWVFIHIQYHLGLGSISLVAFLHGCCSAISRGSTPCMCTLLLSPCDLLISRFCSPVWLVFGTLTETYFEKAVNNGSFSKH